MDRVVDYKSMESRGKDFSKRCHCVGKVKWLVMRDWHTIWYYLVVICWWLHVVVLRTCDSW